MGANPASPEAEAISASGELTINGSVPADGGSDASAKKHSEPEPSDDSTSLQVTPDSDNESSPSSPLASVRRALTRDLIPANRRRVVSLDRGRDLLSSLEKTEDIIHLTPADEEEAKATPRKNNGGSSGLQLTRSTSPDDLSIDEGSHSSDGESSYFAKNLPSPRSGRRFSYDGSGSIRSAPDHYRSSSVNNRESDASLSFSDESDQDSDDDDKPLSSGRERNNPMLPPIASKKQRSGTNTPTSGTDSPLYPQRITRMHSISSLVSSNSDGGSERNFQQGASSGFSSESSSSSIGTSSSSHSGSTPARISNRRFMRPTAPMMGVGGEAPFIPRFFSAPHPQGPPPPQHAYSANFQPYPQGPVYPQPMSSEQMTAWMTSSEQPNNAIPGYGQAPPLPPPGPHFGSNTPDYGAAAAVGVTPSHSKSSQGSSLPRSNSGNSNDPNTSLGDASQERSLPLVYSEDDEMDDAEPPLSYQMAGGIGMASVPSNGPFAYTSNFNGNAYQERQMGGYNSHPNDGSRAASGSAGAGAQIQSRAGGIPPKGEVEPSDLPAHDGKFRVYWQRWIMLMYMSVLNLLSDWTCYSVAPIAVLTQEAFGDIDPEQLVVLFLGANAVSTALEPMILSRLGLRRTVVLGSLLLMIGSMIKSGGVPPIIESNLEKGKGEWRVYLGFFFVGLSQPLYQCTPALLSASWFPEKERTMATGVALNANQLGIGFAFIFGTLLVADSDDIVKYFGLLSIISTLAFIGTLIQFDDAPPTPPSDTARAMRGDLPRLDPNAIWQSVRNMGSGRDVKEALAKEAKEKAGRSSERRGETSSRKDNDKGNRRSGSSSRHRSSAKRRSNKTGSDQAHTGSGTRRRVPAQTAAAENGLLGGTQVIASAPAPASTDRPTSVSSEIAQFELQARAFSVQAPSRMMPGRVGPPVHGSSDQRQDESLFYEAHDAPGEDVPAGIQGAGLPPEGQVPYGFVPPDSYQQAMPYPPLQQPYPDSSYQDAAYHQQHQGYQQQTGYPQQQRPYYNQGYYYYPQGPYHPPPMYSSPPAYPYGGVPYNVYSFSEAGTFDEGAEPVVTQTSHHLDIDIRDDQILLSARACLSRPGFVHALVSFTVSGIVINTLSTFMDYLVRLNGAGREYVGIVGGSFQFVIMISSLIIGKQTDRTRAYYSVTVGMLVLGAFGLAECGVDLDADRGGDLRWALIVVAALVGPLQPVSTELGVEVAYPLSENTVLVIQQLFSNLLSAMFIPFFKALKDVGTSAEDVADNTEKPEYTFSFYLLIVLHASATVFFATFDGRYLRFDHEKEKKAKLEGKVPPIQPSYDGTQGEGWPASPAGERQPLVGPAV